jgi:hypothetical protein
MKTNTNSTRIYFVDEAGDSDIFNKKGKVIIGNSGCSKYFILGLLDILDPASIENDFSNLRKELLSDPYFKGIPSLKVSNRKTAHNFHAKDDLPEVRMRVFNILKSHQNLRFYAVVKNKLDFLNYVQEHNTRDNPYHYHSNELYDFLVRRLFRDRLHQADSYQIYFSKRGHSDRTAALSIALEAARTRFFIKYGIRTDAKINVIPQSSANNSGLQAVDYFLWALQRFYEMHEERYLTYLWDLFNLVIDIDDTRNAHYGAYYSKKKPLNLKSLGS